MTAFSVGTQLRKLFHWGIYCCNTQTYQKDDLATLRRTQHRIKTDLKRTLWGVRVNYQQLKRYGSV
jgi:coenzyme F420-reducing hydrogenase delta subunit